MSTRDNLEGKLGRTIADFWETEFEEIMAQVEAGVVNIDWDEERHKLFDEVRPIAVDGFREGAIATINQILWGKKADIPPDLDNLVTQAALAWVETYLFNNIGAIVETTRVAVANALTEFITVPGFTVGDVFDLLVPWFGEDRALRIGVTEMTRMFMSGGEIAANIVHQPGLEFIAVWRTRNDEIAEKCPICWPRHEKRQGDGWFEIAPGHPNCRCRISYEAITT